MPITPSRRTFLQATVATVAAGAAMAVRRDAEAAEAAAVQAEPLKLPGDVRIVEIRRARHRCQHPRKIGRNSFKDHGPGHDEGLVRVRTSAGVEGIGNDLPDAALGKTLGELLEVRDGRLFLREQGRKFLNAGSEATLLDIVGKVTGRPAAELLGKVVRTKVPCYDGSIYMRELDAGDDAIRLDVENGLAAGHKTFKVKIGRGRWLDDRARGYERDLWAIRKVREVAGDDAKVCVDANNYYTLDESLRLLRDAADVKLYWLEEMFDEKRANWPDYRRLRQAIKDARLDTLLADGETGRGDGDLFELLKEGTVQVSQVDIRTLGLFGMRDHGERIATFGATLAPHVWAKQIGALECCLLGMVLPNFESVEDCRLTSDVVKLAALSTKDGAMTMERAPGLGITIDEAAYKEQCAAGEKVVR